LDPLIKTPRGLVSLIVTIHHKLLTCSASPALDVTEHHTESPENRQRGVSKIRRHEASSRRITE